MSPSSPSSKTMGRVLVLLAMLSTASGWKLPSGSEAPEMTITGEAHDSPITGEVDGARDRRRRLVAAWVVVHAELPCAANGVYQTKYNQDSLSRTGEATTSQRTPRRRIIQLGKDFQVGAEQQEWRMQTSVLVSSLQWGPPSGPTRACTDVVDARGRGCYASGTGQCNPKPNPNNPI